MNGDFWENRAEIGNYPAAVKSLLLTPADFFGRMGAEASFAPAAGFALISLVIAAFIQVFWSLVFGSLEMGAYHLFGSEAADGAQIGVLAKYGTQIVLGIFYPVFAFIGIFIGAGITHLCLVLLGGAQEGYLATAKICLYATAGAVLTVVPCLGDFAYAIWSIVIMTVGLVTVHRTETWRALLAIFLPTIFCCLCCIGVIALIAGFAGAGAFSSFGPLQEILRNLPRG